MRSWNISIGRARIRVRLSVLFASFVTLSRGNDLDIGLGEFFSPAVLRSFLLI